MPFKKTMKIVSTMNQHLKISSCLPLVNSNSKTQSLWSTVQQSRSKNIFNFMMKNLSNTLPTHKNLYKWYLSDSLSCSFCLHPETFQHVFLSCKSYLKDGRYTWCRNSILLIANSLSSLLHCQLYADFSPFPSPALITGDSLWPDLALIYLENALYILELMVGLETDIEVNIT